MKSHAAAMFVTIASITIASSASGLASHPYFEFTGGDVDAQMTVPSGNFIPPGSLEFDSVVADGVALPVTVVLRDPGFGGVERTVCVDYIGTDASFQNRFYVPGTAINWCNKATCTDPTATPLDVGGKDWTGSYAASACFKMNVGQPVPFFFVADILNQGGHGTNTIGNGQTNANAHWGLFPYPFVTSSPVPTTSAIIGVGLADGAYDPAADDDHQDFTVRFTVQPGPDLEVPIPALDEWGRMLLVLAMVAFGLRSVKRAKR